MIIGVIGKPDLLGFGKIIRNLNLYLHERKPHLGKYLILIEDALKSSDNAKGNISKFNSSTNFNFTSRTELIKKSDLVIVFGGDGTLLHVAEEAAMNKKPVMGINLGGLGFLTEAPLNKLNSILDSFFKKESFPNSTKISLQSIHLPSSLNLSVMDIERVCQQISFFL